MWRTCSVARLRQAAPPQCAVARLPEHAQVVRPKRGNQVQQRAQLPRKRGHQPRQGRCQRHSAKPHRAPVEQAFDLSGFDWAYVGVARVRNTDTHTRGITPPGLRTRTISSATRRRKSASRMDVKTINCRTRSKLALRNGKSTAPPYESPARRGKEPCRVGEAVVQQVDPSGMLRPRTPLDQTTQPIPRAAPDVPECVCRRVARALTGAAP